MYQPELSISKVVRGIVLLLSVMLAGTLWLVFVEDYTFLDGLYMVVITVSTVGYKEVRELDGSGKVFVILLIISGLLMMTYTLGAVGRVIIEGSIKRFVGRQRMLRDIENMKGHYLVCGHGRMGQILCEELQREGAAFVVIDNDPDSVEVLAGLGYHVVEGDATDDAVLSRAGITRARGLVAVVSSNVDNLYITLSAREICETENPDLYVLSRATDARAAKKITRAGADRVISPYAIGGMRLVQALLRPTVYDFVDIATRGSGLDLMFEELKISEGSRLDGNLLKDSGIRKDFDVIVIAIKPPSGEMLFNPGPEQALQTGDVLIMLGDKDQLARLADSHF